MVRQQSEVANREHRLRELHTHIINLDQELGLVRERFTQTNELLRQTSVALAQTDARASELAINLRRQLHLTKRLLRLADDFKDAAARLRSSRRWKMANPVAALRALFTDKPLPGYGHLEKTVSQYERWQSAHPEIADIDDAIHALSHPADLKRPKSSGAGFEPQPPTKPIEFATHDEVEV